MFSLLIDNKHGATLREKLHKVVILTVTEAAL